MQLLLMPSLLGCDSDKQIIERTSVNETQQIIFYYMIEGNKVEIDRRTKSPEILDGVRGESFNTVSVLKLNNLCFILYSKLSAHTLVMLNKESNIWIKKSSCLINSEGKSFKLFKLTVKDNKYLILTPDKIDHTIKLEKEKIEVPSLSFKKTKTFDGNGFLRGNKTK
jgi:hypothetical protein